MGDTHQPEIRKPGTVPHRLSVSALPPMLAGLLALVIVFAVHAGVGLPTSSVSSQRLAILFDAGITAIVIAALVWLGFAAFRRVRRQQESDTAELNHQLRNALQLIVDAEYYAEGGTRRSLIMESVARIDRTLRKLFPSRRS